MLNKTRNALISNLKGRISKILTSKVRLEPDELISLELVYQALDSFILSKRKDGDTENLRGVLNFQAKALNSSERDYITQHIIPLMNKVSNRRWDNE